MDIITAALAASMSGGGGGGTGTDDYNELSNKPKINGVTLAGSKSLEDIGAAAASETYTDTEVDALLAAKADADDVYTKAQTDTELAKKVDKETGKGLSTNDFTNADKANLATALEKANAAAPQATTYTKAEVDTALAGKLNTSDIDDALSSTSTNPVQNKAVRAPIARLVDAGAKNIMPYGGLTCGDRSKITFNADGSISGAIATDARQFSWTNREIEFALPPGDYYLIIKRISGNGAYTSLHIMDESGLNVSVSANPNIAPSVRQFSIENTTTVGAMCKIFSDTIYIMLCTAKDYAISSEFVPYAKSNYELTQSVEPIPMLVDAGKKNLIKLDFPTKQVGNVTGSMTADGNGIVINGGRTQTTDTILIYDILTNASSSTDTRYTIPVGRYVVKASGSNFVKIQVYCHDGNNLSQLANSIYDVEFEYTSELKQQYPYINVRIWISNRSNFDHVTIYPMLCTAADYKASSEFVPYAPSNRELYELETQVDKKTRIVKIANWRTTVNIDIKSIDIAPLQIVTIYMGGSQSGIYQYTIFGGNVEQISNQNAGITYTIDNDNGIITFSGPSTFIAYLEVKYL